MVKENAIPVGIERKPDREMGNYLPFVYTCPQTEAVVNLGDSLYVIASSDWWTLSKNKYCLSIQATESPVLKSRGPGTQQAVHAASGLSRMPSYSSKDNKGFAVL